MLIQNWIFKELILFVSWLYQPTTYLARLIFFVKSYCIIKIIAYFKGFFDYFIVIDY